MVYIAEKSRKMTKKKNNFNTKMRDKHNKDNTDYKGNRSQSQDNSKGTSGLYTESSQEINENANTTNNESEAKAASDIDAGPGIPVEEKLAEMQDRYLRLSAEFDNYRKRTLREKMELTKSAGESILLSIIPVMDDFERAMKVMESATDCVAIKSGMGLIYNKFGEFLKQNGIKEIESVNTPFDVDLHEAITKVPVQDESMKGKVVDVVVKGYWLHDKVMRFSKVVVGE
jgi:molecular chaperone GrpE